MKRAIVIVATLLAFASLSTVAPSPAHATEAQCPAGAFCGWDVVNFQLSPNTIFSNGFKGCLGVPSGWLDRYSSIKNRSGQVTRIYGNRSCTGASYTVGDGRAIGNLCCIDNITHTNWDNNIGGVWFQ